MRDKQAMPAQEMAEADVRALVHELQVHQIELEMQNEELLRTQAAFEAASEKYQDLFAFAPVGYFLLDQQGRILEVNLAGAALLGLDRSAAINRRLGLFVALEHRAAFAEFCKGVATTAAKQTCEIEFRRNDEPVYVVVEGVPVEGDEGSRSLRVTVTDISRRRRAEQTLRGLQHSTEQSLALLDTIQTHAPVGIAFVDREFRFVRINEELAAVNGLPAVDHLGRTVAECVPAIWPQIEPLYRRALAGEPVLNVEVNGETAAHPHQRRSWELCLYPVRVQGDLIAGVGVIVLEITDRKRAEQTLKALNETLEQRVAERTAEVEQRAAQLQTLAVELTLAEQRERRRLAQALHGDLQQMLVAARMKVGLLRKRLREEQLVQTIAELDDLLNQTIDGSRSLAAQLCPPVLYERGLGAALEWLARQTQEKFDLSVEVEADPAAEPTEESTQVFLFQAAGELLLNAAKHAQAHRVWVRMSRTEPHQVHMEVCDDGVGFDPAQSAGKPDRGGFGMFSIRARLEVLGGKMEVVSVRGQGTRIMIRLPLEEPAVSTVGD